MSGNRNMTETRDLHTHHEAMSGSHVLIIWNVCEEMRGRAWRGGRRCKKNLVEINVGIGTVHVEIRSAVAGHAAALQRHGQAAAPCSHIQFRDKNNSFS
jgi:hypothetical protein